MKTAKVQIVLVLLMVLSTFPGCGSRLAGLFAQEPTPTPILVATPTSGPRATPVPLEPANVLEAQVMAVYTTLTRLNCLPRSLWAIPMTYVLVNLSWQSAIPLVWKGH